MKHILKSQQFSRQEIEKLFADTDHIRGLYEDPEKKKGLMTSLQGKTMFAIFYEPSSRTRFSFCSAAANLGMIPIWTEDAGKFSSAVKGETLEDSIHAFCQYDPSVIVLRHSEVGAAEKAAKIVDQFGYETSIINAGDGKGQHPTQALLDLYTIKREIGRLDDITVVVGGDLANGRTVRSLVYLLSKFERIQFVFLSPDNLKMGDDIINHLKEHDIKFTETENMKEALRVADIIYWTRVQTERGSINDTVDLTIGVEEMYLVKSGARLMHPLPRVGEIKTEIDHDSRSAYFRQIKNGKFTRMALLEDVCR
ncbi:MAG: aspartate carbamoyltransferase [bacterium]